MSTVTVLSTLAKASTGPDLSVDTTPAIVVVIGLVMIAAIKLFGQFGEVFAHAVQLLRLAITALLTATLLVAVAVVMAVVAVRA